MKVVQINSVCGIGSTGKLVTQISDCLTQNDIDNYIFYGLGTTDRENSFKIGNSFDAHFHSFISRKFCMQGYGSCLSTLRLIKKIRRINPDIMHLHNIHGHYLNFKILFKYLNQTDIKIVWTFHDCWPMTGKCPHFTAVNCMKWKSGCFECPQLKRYPDSEIDRTKQIYIDKKKFFTQKKDLHIVCVSKWLECVAKESFFAGKDIRCIYNGINTDIFYPRFSNIKRNLEIENKKVILGVSSIWNDNKGFEHFCELAKVLDASYRIVIIGKMPKEKKNNLPDNIILVGEVTSQEKLAEYYSMADVLLNLSIEETFGLVVAEALACGTPAIVMDSTACPEVIDEQTGIIVRTSEPKEIKNAINQIQKLEVERKCIDRSRTLFSNERMQQEYLKIYE